MAILKEDKTGDGTLYSVPSGDTNVLLAAGTTYYQTGTGNKDAIYNLRDYSSIVLAGTVYSQGRGISASMGGDGHFHLTLTGSGYLYGLTTALSMSSFSINTRFEVTNAGTIATDGTRGTIEAFNGYLDLTNTGTISGAVAITTYVNENFFTTGRGAIILNSGTISGDILLGIGRDSLTNSGTIRGDIDLGGDSGVLINTGDIFGNIRLGAGSGGGGYIDTHFGNLRGLIYGTNDSDIYHIRGDETIIEASNGGTTDIVYAYGNYVMADGIESLVLTDQATRGYGNASDNFMYAGTHDATLSGRGGDDRLNGGVGDDTLNGGAGDDYLDAYSGGGEDVLYGGTGDDVLASGYLGTIIYGGAGNDMLSFPGSNPVTVDLVRGIGSGGNAQGDLYSSIENVTGTSGADVVIGGAGDNSLYGGGAGDTLRGGDDSDALFGEAGDDLLFGDAGGDRVFGGAGADVSHGGDGNDLILDPDEGGNTLFGDGGDDVLQVSIGEGNRLYGGDGTDLMAGGTGSDLLDGGKGVDTVTYRNLPEGPGIVASLKTGIATSQSAGTDRLVGIENLVGSVDDDVLTGSSAANRLEGGRGTDILYGGGGNDVLAGGASADTLRGDGGVDTADYSGPGDGFAITVDLSTGNGTGGDAEGDKLVSIENVIGVGLSGQPAADMLIGSSAANMLSGLAGNDTLSGGGGDDILIGGAGADQLTGGTGRDVFLFADIGATAGGWGNDVIRDMVDGQDRISFAGASAVHGFADLRITTSGKDVLIAVGQDVIRLIGFDAANLTASDFVF